MKIRARRRGIVMLISLFSMVCILMIAGAAFQLMPTQLRASGQLGERQASLLAASSGVEYAQARLQENPVWWGDGGGVVVNSSALRIVEDEGNVIGLMSSPAGKTAFRMRFNYQNGGSTPDDGFPTDPASNHRISSPYLCCNNLDEGSQQPLFHAAPSGSNWTVAGSATPNAMLPKFTVHLEVEGFSGPGLDSATTENLDGLILAGHGIERVVVETRLQKGGNGQIDSVIYAAGNFAANVGLLGKVTVEEADGVAAPRLRSMGNVNVVGNYRTSAQGKVTVGNPGSFTYTTTNVGSNQETKAQQQASWLRMKWSQVSKSTVADNRLKAGTYVWRLNPATGATELAYFKQNYSGSVPTGTPDQIVTTPAQVSSGSGVSFDYSKLTTTVSQRTYVEPQASATVKDLAILIDPALQVARTDRPNVLFQPATGQESLLSSDGDVHLDGAVDGLGSVTAEQEINIQGTSAFDTDPDFNVALYARGDVVINAIPDPVASSIVTNYGYSPGRGHGRSRGRSGRRGPQPPNPSLTYTAQDADVNLAGLIYTQQNFRVNVPNGSFYLRGIVTAYGGDPDLNQNPGDGVGGNIQVNAHNTEFLYDPSYLTSVTPGVPTPLERVSWTPL